MKMQNSRASILTLGILISPRKNYVIISIDTEKEFRRDFLDKMDVRNQKPIGDVTVKHQRLPAQVRI